MWLCVRVIVVIMCGAESCVGMCGGDSVGEYGNERGVVVCGCDN